MAYIPLKLLSYNEKPPFEEPQISAITVNGCASCHVTIYDQSAGGNPVGRFIKTTKPVTVYKDSVANGRIFVKVSRSAGWVELDKISIDPQ